MCVSLVSGLVPLGVIPTLWPGWSVNTHIWPYDIKLISAPTSISWMQSRLSSRVCCMFTICLCLPVWPCCFTCLSFQAVPHCVQFCFPCLCTRWSLYLEPSFPLFCLEMPVHSKYSVKLKIYTVLFLPTSLPPLVNFLLFFLPYRILYLTVFELISWSCNSLLCLSLLACGQPEGRNCIFLTLASGA